MANALIKDALATVWSAPNPTGQVILNPARISDHGGAINYAQIGMSVVSLPNKTSYWHIYHIGQASLSYFNLRDTEVNEWVSLASVSVSMKLMINLYTAKGIQLPLKHAYYSQIDDRNIVLAIEVMPQLSSTDLNTESVYVRILENLFYGDPNTPNEAELLVDGAVITTTAQIVQFNNTINDIRSRLSYKGGLWCRVNGVSVPEISVLTASVGDVVEYVYDSSVIHTYSIAWNQLKTFTSTLDGKAKYLLFRDEQWDGFIYHCSFADVYIRNAVTKKGRYVHKNAVDSIRMVTYKDYSLNANYMPAYTNQLRDDATGAFKPADVFVDVHVRAIDFLLKGHDDANKIQYLLQLSPAKQLNAMVGVDATNPHWTAASLEASHINALMKMRKEQYTPSAVEAAYGYAATNAAVGQTVNKATIASELGRVVVVPPAYRRTATAYEYDSAGGLLGYYLVGSGSSQYQCANATASYVEFVQGHGGTVLDEYYGNTAYTIDPLYPPRYYCKKVTAAGTDPGYSDVTGTSHYSHADGTLTWANGQEATGFARTDKTHLVYQVVLNPSDGVFFHSVNYTIDGRANAIAAVPFAEYDFWLNGKPLIEGIDYFFKFPNLLICSKSKVIPQANNTLTVRAYGLCDASLKAYRKAEKGFVYNGALSVNGIYDLHISRNLRVVVGSALQSPDNRPFNEVAASGSYANGAPYEIRQPFNALNGILSQDAYAYLEQDRSVEEKAAQYLTLHRPEQRSSDINPIAARYTLYSPFLCKILYALKAGNISAAAIAGPYPDSRVMDLVKPYLYLLLLDPIYEPNRLDDDYVVVHPHWINATIGVTADQYRFIANAARIYAGNLVSVSTALSISA